MKKISYVIISVLALLLLSEDVKARGPVYEYEFIEQARVFRSEEDMLVVLKKISGYNVPGAAFFNAILYSKSIPKYSKFAIIEAVYYEDNNDIVQLKIKVLGTPGEGYVNLSKKEYRLTE